VSAPLLWIFAPLLLAGSLLLPRNQRAVGLVAGIATVFLAAAAWLLPIDVALAAGSGSFKLAPSLEILGRRLTLTSADRAVLVLVYGSAFFWILPAGLAGASRRLIPLGLAITALLVAALAVEPFLYAALLIEMAVLLALPLLAGPGGSPGRGLIRYLIFQTLAMPFILFSGWLLAGIETSPGDLGLVRTAALLLGVGFAFLLGVFPFYTWIPLLAEEAHPYTVGFVLWLFPTVTMFFGLGFIDHYTWLRDSPLLVNVLRAAGLLMVLSGGILSTFERQLARMMAYGVIAETGGSLLALSLAGRTGPDIFLLMLVPRLLSLGIWALSLSILKEQHPKLTLDQVRGGGRSWPFAAAGVVLANLSMAGLPLLAAFPARQALWEGLAQVSLPLAVWLMVGQLGLVIGAMRSLGAFIMTPPGLPWQAHERRAVRIVLAAGWIGLLLLGLLPQAAFLPWSKLPALFDHLGH
jgi:NADH:ubiquinone oxidoreductase subunit 2 (subunit N)